MVILAGLLVIQAAAAAAARVHPVEQELPQQAEQQFKTRLLEALRSVAARLP